MERYLSKSSSSLWCSMSCCHGNIFHQERSCQSVEHKKLWWGGLDGIAFVQRSSSVRQSDSRRRLMQRRAASWLKRIDQFFRTYIQSALQDSKILEDCVCVRACAGRNTEMELFGLKHEWLFHGWVEMPCPRLSRPRDGGNGSSFPLGCLLLYSKMENVPNGLKIKFWQI